MEINTLFGRPAHPLVVHAAVGDRRHDRQRSRRR